MKFKLLLRKIGLLKRTSDQSKSLHGESFTVKIKPKSAVKPDPIPGLVGSYIDELESLKKENQDLANQLISAGNDLIKENDELRNALLMKPQNYSIHLSGADSENVLLNQLMQANEKIKEQTLIIERMRGCLMEIHLMKLDTVPTPFDWGGLKGSVANTLRKVKPSGMLDAVRESQIGLQIALKMLSQFECNQACSGGVIHHDDGTDACHWCSQLNAVYNSLQSVNQQFGERPEDKKGNQIG